jgi:hypothetical protein
MAPLKEYRCAAHGPFEARKPKCPSGCSARFVVQEFRTAPAVRSAATKQSDRELRNLAGSYKMSDIPSVAEGESVMGELRKNPKYAPTWGHVEHNAPGWSQREGEKAKTFSPASMGAQPAQMIQQLKPLFTGPKPILAAPAYRPPV